MVQLSDNVKNFWQQVSENEELAGKFQEAKSHDELIALASEIGLDISAEELQAAQDKLMALAGEDGGVELTDEQLEAVAGGAAFGASAVAAASAHFVAHAGAYKAGAQLGIAAVNVGVKVSQDKNYSW